MKMNERISFMIYDILLFLFEKQMSENKLNLSAFKNTPVIKHLSETNIIYDPDIEDECIANDETKSEQHSVNETKSEQLSVNETKRRGRKLKYYTEEERKEARKRYQREYRRRKKVELERLRELALSIGVQKIIAAEDDDDKE